MANLYRGEYGFIVDDKSYVLRFSADAVCDLEEKLGKTLNKISELMQDPATMSMATIRTMFIVGMVHKHGDIGEDACRAVFKLLSPVEAMSHVTKAFSIAFGVEEGKEGSNPPQPVAAVVNGTGLPSTPIGSS